MKSRIVQLAMTVWGVFASQQAMAQSPIAGRWETGCIKAESISKAIPLPNALYASSSLIYNPDGTMAFKSDYFLSSDCGYKIVTVDFTADYETFDDAGPFDAIDMTVKSYDWTLPSGAIVAGFFKTIGNVIGLCGIKDWQVNTQRSVLGRTCLGLEVPDAGELLPNIYQVQFLGGKAVALQTGMLDDDAESRPTQLDKNTIYHQVGD